MRGVPSRARSRALGVVADGDRAEARDGNADELGDRRPGPGGEAGPAEADHASERDDPVQDGDRGGDQPSDVRGEVVRRGVVDPVVLDDDRVARLEGLEDDALPDEQTGKRDDERWHPDSRHDGALGEPDHGDDRETEQDREPPRVVVRRRGQLELGDRDGRDTAHVRDREIDLPEQEHEDDPERDHGRSRHLEDDVHEVGRREEVRRGEREVGDDRDLAEDDRQDAEISGSDVALGALPEPGLLGRVRRLDPWSDDVGPGGHSSSPAVSAIPATFVGIPAVIAVTTSCWLVAARS